MPLHVIAWYRLRRLVVLWKMIRLRLDTTCPNCGYPLDVEALWQQNAVSTFLAGNGNDWGKGKPQGKGQMLVKAQPGKGKGNPEGQGQDAQPGKGKGNPEGQGQVPAKAKSRASARSRSRERGLRHGQGEVKVESVPSESEYEGLEDTGP